MLLESEQGKGAMLASANIAVVIPCYRVRRHITGVIQGIPEFVKHIVVVDDACPENSGDAAQAVGDPRVKVVRHAQNRGVGGAMKTGFAEALTLRAQIVVKLDGDGQMDSSQIARLCRPLLLEKAAFAKYNRFWYFAELQSMPLARRIGNLGLSFLTKAASGQWRVFDPTNGFVAVRGDVLGCLRLAALSDDYFFETSLLIELGKRGFRVADLPLPARYGDEKSSMKLSRILVTFPIKLLVGGISRVWCRHFWFDFTLAAVLLSLGIPMSLWGIGFGAYAWSRSVETQVTASAGTVMLAALPLLLGANMLLQAISLEVSDFFNTRVSPDGEV
jgi:glycosyltransferase involved in cell wall biosynthesis